MLGPGHGANIETIIDFLNVTNNFKLSLFTDVYKFDKERFPKLNVITYNHSLKLIKRFCMLVNMVRVKKHNILMILGGTNLYETIPAIFLFRYNFLIFNIWGEYIPQMIGNKDKNIPCYLFRAVLNKSNCIICSWYGTVNTICKNYPQIKDKIFVLDWGIGEEMKKENDIQCNFTKQLIDTLPHDKMILLNQRSISGYNAIELQAQAIKKIVDNHPEIAQRIFFIVWQGNNFDKLIYDRVSKFIKDYSLESIIRIVLHPYLPESDVAHIIKLADVIVNLVYHDQISKSIIETMYFQKQGLLSDIEPYRILNEQYQTQFNLVRLDSNAIAEEIIRLFYLWEKGEKDLDLLNKRKMVVDEYFNLNKNAYKFDKIITELYSKYVRKM